MDFLNIKAGAGSFGFVGQIHTDKLRPSLLVVNGSFPPKDHLHDLVSQFFGANVLIASLPGMGGVAWSAYALPDLTGALEQAVTRLLPDLPIVALGVSTGNLLSLGLRLPNIRRRIAVEPFFQTKDLWPFIANSRERMLLNPRNAFMAHYFWEVFGIGADRVENRDYRRLLEAITVPTDVLAGGALLLPEREFDGWPSFTSEEDRAALAANPLVTMHIGGPNTGHGFGVMGSSYPHLKKIALAALLDIAPPAA